MQRRCCCCCVLTRQALPTDEAAALCLPACAGSHRDFAAKNSAALYDPAKNQAIPLPDFALRRCAAVGGLTVVAAQLRCEAAHACGR